MSAMACNDRTQEFSHIVNSLSSSSRLQSSQQVNQKVNGSQRQGNVAKLSQFTLAARDISHNLTRTFTKVEKLSMLTKKQSLFEDRGPEIQELTYIIKQDIGSLGKQLIELQAISRSQNSSLLSSGASQTGTHSQGVVQGLNSRLGKMRHQFEGLLKTYWEALKRQEERRGQFVGSPEPTTTSNGPTRSGKLNSDTVPNGPAVMPSRLLQDELRARSNQILSDGMANESSLPHTIIDMQQAQQITLLHDQTDAYLQSRTDAMSSIESTMQELGRIFTQLASMVKEQEESIARIDTNVDVMQTNVESAHSELLRYFKGISNNRWLAAKIAGIVFFFFLLFIILFS